MKYPAGNGGTTGEQVNYNYLPQMALKDVLGSYAYVLNLSYDAAGRLMQRQSGSVSGNVVVQYTYYPWDAANKQGGYLQRLNSGVPADLTSLQDLRYTYDWVGNVKIIEDYKAGDLQLQTPQKQTFFYDNFYRLTGAKAENGTGGSGNYDESASLGYSYNANNGNLASKRGVSYTYGSHVHAATALSNGNTYGYDANGNMTQRHVYENGAWKDYTLSYDAENHLPNVTGAATAQFTYNGDGQRVKSVENGTTKVYIGNYFEWVVNNSTMKKYYYAGSTRVAMREGANPPLWLLGDHLGSTNKVALYNGTFRGEQRYKAWGETRFVAGDIPTDFKFTGQREVSSIGLYDYGARWYDPSPGRFTQPDIVIPKPGAPLTYDRYSYVLSNPIRYNDPTGYCSGDEYDPNLDEDQKECWRLYDSIPVWFPNVSLSNPGDFDVHQLANLYRALRLARKAFGSQKAFARALGSFKVYGPESLLAKYVDSHTNALGMAPFKIIILTESLFKDKRYTVVFNILHEMGHIFDFHNSYLSQKFADTYGEGCTWAPLGCVSAGSSGYPDWLTSEGYNPDKYRATGSGMTGSIDDFAESFAAAVLVMNNVPKGGDWYWISMTRINILRSMIYSFY